MSFPTACIAVSCMTFLITESAQADILYALKGGILHQVNTNTLSATPLFDTQRDDLGGLTTNNNTLYAVSRSSPNRSIHSIDLQSQSLNYEFSIQQPSNGNAAFHALASQEDEFFVFDGETLLEYQTSGARRLVRNMHVDTVIHGADFGPDGLLWAHDRWTHKLYHINLATGDFSYDLVTNNPTNGKALVFGLSGTLWLMTDTDLYSYNAANLSFDHSGTVTGWGSDDDLTGLAVLVPSASSAIPCISLALGFASRRKRSV